MGQDMPESTSPTLTHEEEFRKLRRHAADLEHLRSAHLHIERALRASEKRYKRITAVLTDYIYTVRVRDSVPIATIHAAACVNVTGYSAEEFARDRYLWPRMVPEADRDRVKAQATKTLAGITAEPIEHRLARKDGAVRWVRSTQVPDFDANRKMVAYDGLLQDITERKEQERQREQLVDELRCALAKVNMLSDLLPICMACKRIRNDSGYWEQIELFIRDHSDAKFSHGLCPACRQQLYPSRSPTHAASTGLSNGQ